MEVQDLIDLKKELDIIAKNIDKKQGALEQLYETLNENGFKTVQDVQKEVQRLQKLKKDKEMEYDINIGIIEKEISEWND